MIKIFMAITLAVVVTSTTVEEYPTDEPIDSFITSNNPGAIIADAKDDEPIFIEVEDEEEPIAE